MITAERRFAALSIADPGRLAALAERILDLAASSELIAGPRPATMLVELIESVRAQPFHLGEVLVTEATVHLDGVRGDGVVLGLAPERATAAAVCDAAAGAGLLAAEVDELVLVTEAARATALAAADEAIAGTRIAVEVIA